MFLDGNGHGGLPAGLRLQTCGNLDGKSIPVSDRLGVQVATVEFRPQGMGNIARFDASVQDSAFHVLDYNPFISGDDLSSYFMYIFVYGMKKIRFYFPSLIAAVLIAGLGMVILPRQARAEVEAQSGVVVTVIYSEPINVRGGPSTVYYPIVGRVSPGDVLPALGVSPGREWVQVAYPDAPGGVGWLYAAYVSVSGGELRVVEPPPTQTQIATATVNPTFAAAFIFQPTATRLPTFTPPPPLTPQSFSDTSSSRPSGLAAGVIVFSLTLIGIAVYTISLALGRQ